MMRGVFLGSPSQLILTVDQNPLVHVCKIQSSMPTEFNGLQPALKFSQFKYLLLNYTMASAKMAGGGGLEFCRVRLQEKTKWKVKIALFQWKAESVLKAWNPTNKSQIMLNMNEP